MITKLSLPNGVLFLAQKKEDRSKKKTRQDKTFAHRLCMCVCV